VTGGQNSSIDRHYLMVIGPLHFKIEVDFEGWKIRFVIVLQYIS